MLHRMSKMVNRKCTLQFDLIAQKLNLTIKLICPNYSKGDAWPPRVIMQLMPKQLIGNIGGQFLKDSKTVVFHPTACESLENLTKMMSQGFVSVSNRFIKDQIS